MVKNPKYWQLCIDARLGLHLTQIGAEYSFQQGEGRLGCQ